MDRVEQECERQFAVIDEMAAEEKAFVKRVLDALLTKKKLQVLAS